jgi:hypothetical protein
MVAGSAEPFPLYPGMPVPCRDHLVARCIFPRVLPDQVGSIRPVERQRSGSNAEEVML